MNASTTDQPSIAPLTAPVQQAPNQSAGQVAQLNEQQLVKLQSELDVVQGNMRVLAEMLAYFTSPDQSYNQPDPADLALLDVSMQFICCINIRISYCRLIKCLNSSLIYLYQ